MAIVRPNIYSAGAYQGDPLIQEKRQRSQKRSDHMNRILQAGTQAFLRQNAIDSALAKQKEMYQDLLFDEELAVAGEGGEAAAESALDAYKGLDMTRAMGEAPFDAEAASARGNTPADQQAREARVGYVLARHRLGPQNRDRLFEPAPFDRSAASARGNTVQEIARAQMRSPEFLQGARQDEADANIAFSRQVAERMAADRAANAPRDQRVAQAALAQMTSSGAGSPAMALTPGQQQALGSLSHGPAQQPDLAALRLRGNIPRDAVIPSHVTSQSIAESESNALRMQAIQQLLAQGEYDEAQRLAEIDPLDPDGAEQTGARRRQLARQRQAAEKQRQIKMLNELIAKDEAEALLRQRYENAAGRAARRPGY